MKFHNQLHLGSKHFHVENAMKILSHVRIVDPLNLSSSHLRDLRKRLDVALCSLNEEHVHHHSVFFRILSYSLVKSVGGCIAANP